MAHDRAGAYVAVALIGAAWLSSRISRPLRDLARKTSEIDLDRLDQSFDSDRPDEIGALSPPARRHDRATPGRLRQAARGGASGRRGRPGPAVNHDIKNGLGADPQRPAAPLPGRPPGPSVLPAVFEDRQARWSRASSTSRPWRGTTPRLSPRLERRPCDLNAVVDQILRNTTSDGVEIRARLSERLPPVLGDSLMLRRILENLIGNAVDSLAGRKGGDGDGHD